MPRSSGTGIPVEDGMANGRLLTPSVGASAVLLLAGWVLFHCPVVRSSRPGRRESSPTPYDRPPSYVVQPISRTIQNQYAIGPKPPPPPTHMSTVTTIRAVTNHIPCGWVWRQPPPPHSRPCAWSEGVKRVSERVRRSVWRPGAPSGVLLFPGVPKGCAIGAEKKEGTAPFGP